MIKKEVTQIVIESFKERKDLAPHSFQVRMSRVTDGKKEKMSENIISMNSEGGLMMGEEHHPMDPFGITWFYQIPNSR